MKKRKKSILPPLLCLAILLPGLTFCTHKPDGSSEQLTETIDSFATHFFNYHYQRAARFCTPESEKWLRFAASNVTQADVDLLREQEEAASVSFDTPLIQADDTLLTVDVTVRNHLLKDSIGQPGTMKRKSEYRLKAVKHGGRWLIRLENLPRNIRKR